MRFPPDDDMTFGLQAARSNPEHSHRSERAHAAHARCQKRQIEGEKLPLFRWPVRLLLTNVPPVANRKDQ